jgi:hypothetical protein
MLLKILLNQSQYSMIMDTRKMDHLRRTARVGRDKEIRRKMFCSGEVRSVKGIPRSLSADQVIWGPTSSYSLDFVAWSSRGGARISIWGGANPLII